MTSSTTLFFTTSIVHNGHGSVVHGVVNGCHHSPQEVLCSEKGHICLQV